MGQISDIVSRAVSTTEHGATSTEIRALVEEYQQWLRENTSVRSVNGWEEITVPLMDRHNDHLQIYARKEDGEFRMTDDGYTLSDLEMSGCPISTPHRKQLLGNILKGYGVREVNGALEISAPRERFAWAKHNLLQAMLAVDDMFMLAQPVVTSLFLDDVMEWLDKADVRYSSKVKITGKTGFDHVIDFLIPKSSRAPERFVKVVNHPKKDQIQSTVFSLLDTREQRPTNTSAYAVLNDAETKEVHHFVNGLQAYGITPILWHQRDNFVDALRM